MSVVALIIIGIAAGFIATRVMKLNTDVLTTMAIGIGGALIGGFLLRTLLMMVGWMAGFVGAVFGAITLIWLYKVYIAR